MFNMRSKPAQMVFAAVGIGVSLIHCTQGAAAGNYVQLGCGLTGLAIGSLVLYVAVSDFVKDRLAAAQSRPADSFAHQAPSGAAQNHIKTLRERRNERLQDALAGAVICGLSTGMDDASALVLGGASGAFALAKLGMAAINTVQMHLPGPGP